MASVNPSSSSAANIYAALGSKNKGIGGLATGLDTDSLVAALTAGAKAKIAKQGQDKQLLNWKMTAYRSMTSALNAFQSKSFSNTNMATNIMSESFFNTYKATSTSSKVSVSATSKAVTGNFTIDQINHLATTESLKSKTHLSKDLVLDNLTDGQTMASDAFTGQTLKISYNGSIKTIKLDSLNDAIVGGQLDLDELQTKLQDLIDVAIPKKSAYNSATGKYDLLASTVVVGKTDDGNKLKLDSDSARLVIEGDNSVLGIKGGDTNRTNLNKTIGEIDFFKDSLQGDVLKFNINGTEITANRNDTLNSLMIKINSSSAGVRMTYSIYTDEFTLTSTKTGGGENIVLRDVQGNLMNSLFGAQGANGFGSNYLVTSDVLTSQDVSKLTNYVSESSEMKELAAKLGKMEFQMTINGVTKYVKVDTTAIPSDKLSKGTFTPDDIFNAMNKGIQNAFDTTDVKFGAELDSGGNYTGKISIYTTNGAAATLSADRGGIMDLLGFTGPVSNVNTDYNSLTFGDLMTGRNLGAGDETLTIFFENDPDKKIDITYNANMSIQDFIDKINTDSNGAITASIKNGQLSVLTKSGYIKVEDTGSLLKDVFKTDEFETEDKAYAAGAHTAGQNAEIVVDGHVLSEFSNTFTINGVSITITDTSDTKIDISVVSDPDDVVKKITSWIDDYNALIFTLNSAINESKNKDYFPLTDDQKADMTEDQIKTWEAEAKKGVLRNDSTLRDILTQLRQSLYEKVESAGISLYDIGITTKRNAGANEAGQLEFDTNVTGGGEAKLRAMLQNNPDKVRLLFTDASSGIAVKMNSVINKAASEKSIDRGTLVRIAGTDRLTGDNTSVLGDKISAIDKFIATLKSRMEAEYARQWKKFSALEVAVQRMSAQSSWLNQS